MLSAIIPIYQQEQTFSSQSPSGTGVADDTAAVELRGIKIADHVNLSKAARTLKTDQKKSAGPDGEHLDEDQKRQVDQLKKRDQEVKAHERAHMAAGGGLVQGGASYTYQRGADGKLYAVGGEVKIDTSAERDPDQTIRKMQQVKRAALAPANPSGTDRAVAARASQIELQARMEKAQQIKDENNTTGVQSNAEIQSNTKVQLDNGSLDSRGGDPYQRSKNHMSPLGHQINLSA
jgi:hypothetical protein